MAKEVFIEKESFETIVNNMSEAADYCELNEARIEETQLIDSTNIMYLLEQDTYEMGELVEMYRNHSSAVLPKAFDTLKQSLINVDEAAGKAMRSLEATVRENFGHE
ncbi:MAG: hypothetical protein K6D38_03465 [Pseudobutyrivibrio sp.]|nr:hypothetical protein [Pseudobutyrivibrio sp.]